MSIEQPGLMYTSDAACTDCGTPAPPCPDYVWLFKPGLYYFWYMLDDKLWDKVTKTSDGIGMLCIRCFRRRLRRKLTTGDFKSWMRINYLDRGKYRFNEEEFQRIADYANGDDSALVGTSHEGKV